MMELPRTELLAQLEQMSRSGSLLVIGGPGTGKSWLLRQFAIRREAAGDAVLLLLADEHNYVSSLTELQGTLGLRAGLIPTLAAYKGPRKFLVIDSLDSLRAEASQRVFRQLIRDVQRELPDWIVVVSIRSFDAKESLELQRLFPLSNGDSAGIRARHLVVPVLTVAEIDSAANQDARLLPILSVASDSLQEILRNPFNLWLVIHLLDEKIEVEWLHTIETEVQLFERYWYYRLASREDAYDRLAILTKITSAMVDGRTLSVPLREAYTGTGGSSKLYGLLSDEILKSTQTSRIAYVHNIFFDYAVARLLIDENSLFDFLEAPNRSIFFRPSISYFLARIWYEHRALFWQLVFDFFAHDKKLPQRIRVLPGMAVYLAAANLEDLRPLFSLGPGRSARLIESVLRAIRFFDGLTSRRAALWIDLIYRLSDEFDLIFLNEYVALLEVAIRQNNWTARQEQELCSASLRFLQWLWDRATSTSSRYDADQLLSIAAGRVLPVVIRFFPIAPDEVRNTLRQVLDRIGKPESTPMEAYWLGSSIDTVIDFDPGFAVDIYTRIFAYKEKSRTTTQIGGSKVLVMTSTRAQDYSMAYYVLNQHFRRFLQRDVVASATAVARALNAEVRREHVKRRRNSKYTATFTFREIRSRFIGDASHIWDQGHRDIESLQMLDGLLGHVSRLTKGSETSADTVWEVLEVIAKENQFPIVWRRFIQRATVNPELLHFVIPLLRSPEVLAAPEITVAAGNLIGRHFKALSVEDREKVEEAIWSVPTTRLAQIYRDPIAQRDRLLACIPEEDRSERTRQAVEAAKTKGISVENRPFVQFSTVSHPVTDAIWLREHGIDAEAEPNRRILEVKPTLSAFEMKYLNETPTAGESESILSTLEVAFERVTSEAEAPEKVITSVFATVAAVAETILKNSNLDVNSKVVTLCRKIVIEAATYPHPGVGESEDDDFDSPAWSPTPKIEGSQGIMRYVFNWGLDEELGSLLQTLSSDPAPAVRFQIADGLAAVYKPNRELFWKLANAMQATERATGVLVILARRVGQAYIAQREPGRVVKLFSALLRRKAPKRRPEDLLGAIIDSLVYLDVFVRESTATELIKSFERAPLRHAIKLQLIAMSASYYLDYHLEADDLESQAIRTRARELEHRILSSVDIGLQSFERHSTAAGRNVKKEREWAQELLRVVDHLVIRLAAIVRAEPEASELDMDASNRGLVRRFFLESADLWNTVVGLDTSYRRPIAPPTAHYLMESFNRLLWIAPAQVLKLAWSVITGSTLGYQFDEMAVREFVRFADVILADHRELLREEQHALRFAEILDVFVEAGWPEATRIVMMLEEAVR